MRDKEKGEKSKKEPQLVDEREENSILICLVSGAKK